MVLKKWNLVPLFQFAVAIVLIAGTDRSSPGKQNFYFFCEAKGYLGFGQEQVLMVNFYLNNVALILGRGRDGKHSCRKKKRRRKDKTGWSSAACHKLKSGWQTGGGLFVAGSSIVAGSTEKSLQTLFG